MIGEIGTQRNCWEGECVSSQFQRLVWPVQSGKITMELLETRVEENVSSMVTVEELKRRGRTRSLTSIVQYERAAGK